MILVSACLAGVKCAYDGKARPCQKVIELVEQDKAIPVCPEQLGGMPTPRIPCEQQGNKVVNQEGQDKTAEFKKGAQEALKIAKFAGCQKAILKSKSPSCGAGQVYDGTFTNNVIDGDGVFAGLLRKNGIEVLTEKEI